MNFVHTQQTFKQVFSIHLSGHRYSFHQFYEYCKGYLELTIFFTQIRTVVDLLMIFLPLLFYLNITVDL